MSASQREREETSFWRKIRRFAVRAGRAVIEKALILYFCMRDPATPYWAKAVIVGALSYFVLPLDAVPDFIPGVGFADDLAVLASALTTILAHVRAEHRDRARELLEWEWLRNAGGAPNRDDQPPDSPPSSHVPAAERYAVILGVAPDSDPATIRAHYLELVKKYHPDRVQHLGPEFQQMAEQKLKDINEAYAFFKSTHPEL